MYEWQPGSIHNVGSLDVTYILISHFVIVDGLYFYDPCNVVVYKCYFTQSLQLNCKEVGHVMKVLINYIYQHEQFHKAERFPAVQEQFHLSI